MRFRSFSRKRNINTLVTVTDWTLQPDLGKDYSNVLYNLPYLPLCVCGATLCLVTGFDNQLAAASTGINVLSEIVRFCRKYKCRTPEENSLHHNFLSNQIK